MDLSSRSFQGTSLKIQTLNFGFIRKAKQTGENEKQGSYLMAQLQPESSTKNLFGVTGSLARSAGRATDCSGTYMTMCVWLRMCARVRVVDQLRHEDSEWVHLSSPRRSRIRYRLLCIKHRTTPICDSRLQITTEKDTQISLRAAEKQSHVLAIGVPQRRDALIQNTASKK